MSNIVITGANQGIGYYFVEQALKNGNKVAVLDIKTDIIKTTDVLFIKESEKNNNFLGIKMGSLSLCLTT